jgi:hypothetical protein
MAVARADMRVVRRVSSRARSMASPME